MSPEGQGSVAARAGLPVEKGLAALAGQAAAVRALRAAAAKPVHAYLFVGPPGTGKLAAATAFAEMLLCPGGGGDGCDVCRRVALHAHPDFIVVEREGAAMSIDQARDISRTASRSSLEGGKVVIVLPDLHLAREAVPALLKTIEEPPPSTVFVILAEFVPAELVTVASRCVRVDFRPLAPDEVAEALAAEGVAPEQAASVARMAGGRLDRARLLATDPEAQARWQAWEAVPGRLDGTGATVAAVADELVELLKRSVAPLVARQEAEVAALVEHNTNELPSAPAKIVQSAARHGRARTGGAAPSGAAPPAHRRTAHGVGRPGRCLPRPGSRRRPGPRPGGGSGGPDRRTFCRPRLQPGRGIGHPGTFGAA